MRITLNEKLNVAYVYFQDQPADVKAVELADDLIMDVDADGTVYGLELLNARKQLAKEDFQELEVENEESGERRRVELPFSASE